MTPDWAKTKEMSCQLTHSPRLINVDTQPGVSADPWWREIPRRKLWSHSGLPTWHLFSSEAASIPLLPHLPSSAPTPVALLFLPIQALCFRRPCISWGRGAGGGSAMGFWIRVCAEAVKIHQLGFFLSGQLKLPQWLFRTGVWSCFRALLCGSRRWRFFWDGEADEVDCARLCYWGRGLMAGSSLPRATGLWNWTRSHFFCLLRLLNGCCYLRFRWMVCGSFWYKWFLGVFFWLIYAVVLFFRCLWLCVSRRTTVQGVFILLIWRRWSIFITGNSVSFFCLSLSSFAFLNW